MNVIARASDLDGRLVLILEDCGQISVHLRPQRGQKQGFAMLRAERKMNVQLGERLRHTDSPISPLQGLREWFWPLHPGRWPGCDSSPLWGSIVKSPIWGSKVKTPVAM